MARFGKIAVMIVLAVFIGSAGAYTISRNRNMTFSMEKTLPQKIILDAEDIDWLMKCKAPGGATAYQAGFSDACDIIRSRFGIGPRFRTAPSSGIMTAVESPIRTLSVKRNPAGYYPFNVSTMKIEYYNGTHVLYPMRNMTVAEIRVYER